jgi:hypothetical protein
MITGRHNQTGSSNRDNRSVGSRGIITTEAPSDTAAKQRHYESIVQGNALADIEREIQSRWN